MIKYSIKNQQADGSWIPLWFGNQNTLKKENKVYGTAKVTTYLKDGLEILDSNLKQKLESSLEKSEHFLIDQQNSDGSWGAEKVILGTIEETALAISALASKTNENICINGLTWIEKEIETNGLSSSPIGLYFATLWYDEKLYPHVFLLEALKRMIPIEQ